MENQAEFKLPLLGKSMKLHPLPGQDPQREYGVIWDACPQPSDGFGYVFEFTGKRRGRFLAWLTANGAAYACDGPLAYIPEGEPNLLLSRLPNNEDFGQVQARRGARVPLQTVSRFARSRTSTFAFEQPSCDIGPYAGSSLGLRTFAAVGYLAFVHIPSAAQTPVLTGLAADVMGDLLRPPLPDALDMLVHRVRSAQPGAVSGFERYAARLLEEAGASMIRPLAARTALEAGRLSSTGLAWLRFDDSALSAGERQLVLAVESALNRLLLVQEAVEGFPGTAAPYAGFDEGFCSQQDWRCIIDIASGAAEAVQRSERENPLRQMHGVHAARGGEWDVRTRFAQACETMRLPFRMEYRFDADAAGGTVAVECSVPQPEAFPSTRWDGVRGAWEDVRMLRGWAASAYAMRLAALLAAAAFGAGVGIARAYVTVRPGGLDAPVGMSLRFDRISFMSDVLPLIAEGALGADRNACDPAAVLALLNPADCSAAFSDDGFFGVAQPLDIGLESRRSPLWEDDRALPGPLSELLQADRVCELDVLHDEDADLTARVSVAMEDAESSPLASIVLLEEIAAQAGERESKRAAEGGSSDGRVPLYCANPCTRMLVRLSEADVKTRYSKASDAAFAAQSSLSRLYAQVGDVTRALEVAEACRSLAPTSLPGYLDGVSVLMDEGRFAEAEELARRALRIASDRRDSSYLRYRLAYSLWKQDRFDLALACYTSVTADGGDMAGHAEIEMADLMEQMGMREHLSNDAAAATLHENGIPAAPTSEVMGCLAQAALGLADTGILRASAFPAYAVAQLASDDALIVVARSLESGLDVA